MRSCAQALEKNKRYTRRRRAPLQAEHRQFAGLRSYAAGRCLTCEDNARRGAGNSADAIARYLQTASKGRTLAESRGMTEYVKAFDDRVITYEHILNKGERVGYYSKEYYLKLNNLLETGLNAAKDNKYLHPDSEWVDLMSEFVKKISDLKVDSDPSLLAGVS